MGKAGVRVKWDWIGSDQIGCSRIKPEVAQAVVGWGIGEVGLESGSNWVIGYCPHLLRPPFTLTSSRWHPDA